MMKTEMAKTEMAKTAMMKTEMAKTESAKNYAPKELDETMKDLLRNINRCCMKINEQQNLNCTFKKLDFLVVEGFYDDEARSEKRRETRDEIKNDNNGI
jgi:hypothetical protein